MDERRWIGLAGMAGVVVLWLAIAVAGALAPGYEHMRDAVSVLGMRGAAHGWILDGIGLPAFALGTAITGLQVARRLRPRYAAIPAGVVMVLVAAGGLMVGLSPCQSVTCAPAESAVNAHHVLGSTITFGLAPLAALLLATGAFRRGPHRRLCLFSLGLALAMIAAHLLLRTAVFDPRHQWFGLWQRIIIVTITAWIFGVSAALWRRPAARTGP